MKRNGNKLPEVLKVITRLLWQKKAQNIIIFDVSKVLTGICKYFIIATGYTSEHLRSLTEEIYKKMKKKGDLSSHIEGYSGGKWILIDLDFIIVHLFLEDVRKYYDLESLWGDTPKFSVKDVLKK